MTVDVTLLEGPLTIAFRKQGREWYARALQFDLAGIGSTRRKAFYEITQLVCEYITDCLNEKGPVQFEYPSDPTEWNVEDKESFRVTVSISLPEKSTRKVPRSVSIADLRRYRHNVESVGLVPAGV